MLESVLRRVIVKIVDEGFVKGICRALIEGWPFRWVEDPIPDAEYDGLGRIGRTACRRSCRDRLTE